MRKLPWVSNDRDVALTLTTLQFSTVLSLLFLVSLVMLGVLVRCPVRRNPSKVAHCPVLPPYEASVRSRPQDFKVVIQTPSVP